MSTHLEWYILLLFITFWKNVLLHFFLSTHVWVRISLVYCRYVWVHILSDTPPIYHILEKCTATFSSYLSLKHNPVFGASAQRISRASYTAVVALTATCDKSTMLYATIVWYYLFGPKSTILYATVYREAIKIQRGQAGGGESTGICFKIWE